MLSKYVVPALCAAASINSVAAGSAHRHLHKKDLVYAATELDVTTVYETVTVTAGEEPTSSASVVEAAESSAAMSNASTPSSSAISSSAPVVVPTTSTEAPATSAIPTTLATATKAATSVQAPVVQQISTTSSQVKANAFTEAEVSTSTPVATSSAAVVTTSTSSASSGGVKRGLAFNDAALVTIAETVAGEAFGWMYNWGSSCSGLSSSSLEFVPMLWSSASDHSSDWDSKASSAIYSGSSALLSFNEPDNAGQANMSPSDAAAAHIQYMNPYSSKARISSPAITSSQGTDQGTDWLEKFFTACGGKCSVDFCAAHWYGPGGEAGADEMLAHLLNVQKSCQGKNVWLTEFASISGDASSFMTRALDQLDKNSTYSFVEKYSYFYLAAGSLMNSVTSLSSLGQIYASKY